MFFLRMIPASVGMLVLTFSATAQTILMDASTNNGSFETVDPHNAPRSNGSGRRAGTGETFNAANWTITSAGFSGIDAPGIGEQDGFLTLVANHNSTVTFVSDPIFQTVQDGDTFDISFFTARNAADSMFDYAVSLRFDEDENTDLEILTGTDNESASSTWIERSATGLTYQAGTEVSSIQVVIQVSNDTGGPVDQVYLDNITLSGTFVGLNPSGDEDMDGISNGDEETGALNPYNGVGEFVGVGNGGAPTNANDSDSDDDGISDNDEITGANGFVTNPNSQDTDGDTLLDNDERDTSIGFDVLTDPTKPDTDEDQLPDLWELNNMLAPNDNGLTLVDNGPDGDPDMDGLFNLEEFFEGTNPQNEDSDGDDVLDGDEINDGTDPLNPDFDNDQLNDGQERDLGTDPIERDTDFDGFSDFAETMIFMTDPTDFDSTPDVISYLDFNEGNGSFEDTTGGTNPSQSGQGARFAANAEDTTATLPGWSATWVAGFVGFDSIPGRASEGSFYGFVNAGSSAVFESDPIGVSLRPAEEFILQIDTANNLAGETAELRVFVLFDGTPVSIGPALTVGGELPDAFLEQTFTFTRTAPAQTVAIRMELDNTNGGNDQPRIDNIRLYSREGVLPITIASISRDGDNLTLTFDSMEGQTYTVFYSLDLTDFTSAGNPPVLSNSVGAAAGESETTATFNLTDTFGVGSVPDVLFLRIEENTTP